jgi:hypothetical protein
MTIPLDNTKTARATLDLRDLARRVVVATAAMAGLVGILAGRPLFTAIERAGLVSVLGLLLIAAAEAVVRRSRRRVVR